jgi:hypothetical protein
MASVATTSGGVTTVVAVCWRCIVGEVATTIAAVRPPRSPGSSRPRAGSGLSLSLLLSARGMRGGSHGMDIHHGVDAGTPRMTKPPFLVRQMSKWFYDTSTSTSTRAVRCGSLLEGLRSLRIELWRKYDEHEDLHGSGRRSVIPYIHKECCCIVVCVLFKLGVELGCFYRLPSLL